MAFQTKAFGVFYKHFPSTSFQSTAPLNRPLLSENAFDVYSLSQIDPWTGDAIFWYKSGSNISGADTFQSWFNYPRDRGITADLNWRTTRASVSSYRALPWGSHACDFLWNVLVPSWSAPFNTTEGQETGRGDWRVIYSSRSFHYDSGSVKRGVQSYNVTSSWHVFDTKMVPDSSGSVWPASTRPNFVIDRYTGGGGGGYGPYDQDMVLVSPYSSSDAATGRFPIPTPSHYYASCSYLLGSDAARETSSIDSQYFDRGSGAAITRAEVSRSLVTASLFGSATSGTNLEHYRKGLKNRRLYFPTPYSGSGTTLGTDYWLKAYTGYKATDMFTENGGIYAVDFTLKRYVAGDRYPDDNSFMSVFIHDVNTQAPVPASRIAGTSGWYPPSNNIVTIGSGYNASPTLAFYDASTGYLHEKFSILLVQYGYPAQLCFEVSGSLTNDKYFGIIVDDVNFCKLGVTTDPNFIKPNTQGDRLIRLNPLPPGSSAPIEDEEA